METVIAHAVVCDGAEEPELRASGRRVVARKAKERIPDHPRSMNSSGAMNDDAALGIEDANQIGKRSRELGITRLTRWRPVRKWQPNPRHVRGCSRGANVRRALPLGEQREDMRTAVALSKLPKRPNLRPARECNRPAT